jgi:hypothetical protein
MHGNPPFQRDSWLTLYMSTTDDKVDSDACIYTCMYLYVRGLERSFTLIGSDRGSSRGAVMWQSRGRHLHRSNRRLPFNLLLPIANLDQPCSFSCSGFEILG